MTHKQGIYALLLALLVGVMSVPQPSHAQTNKRDSLGKLLINHQSDDTTKVALLLALAIEYSGERTDTICKLARQAIDLSEQLSFPLGIANGYETLGLGCFGLGKVDSALQHYHKAVDVSKQYDFEETLGSTFNDIGNVYLRQANYATALAYYDSAVVLGEKWKNEVLLAKANSNTAIIYYKMGNYAQALESYKRSLKSHVANKSWQDVEKELLNIANVYYQLADYQQAINYLDSCNVVTERTGSQWSRVSILTTYSMIYDKREMYDSALVYQLQAKELAVKINSAYLTNLINQNLAECYMKVGDLDHSLDLYQASVSASQAIGDAEGLAIANAGVGQVCIKKGKLRKGIPYLEKGLAAMRDLGLRDGAKEASGELYKAYEKLGNYKKALQVHKVFSAYTDTLNTNSEKAKVQKAEFQFQLSQKQKNIDELKQIQLIEEAKHSRRKIFLIIAVLGFLAFGIIAYLTVRNLMTERKAKRKIQAQKAEIEHQAAHLKELNSFKDMTFSVLSHDLRSPINALSSTMMLMDENLISPEEFAMHKQELNNKLQSVSLILDNLLLWARDQMKGEHTLDMIELNLHAKVKECTQVLKDPADQKNITIHNKVPEDTIAYGDRNQVLMVIRNILSNAVKFTPQDGEVTVEATKHEKYTMLSIEDTGVGMSQEKVDSLFSGYTNASTIGTGGEKGTGIGLMLSYRFIKQNGGDIIVDSFEGKGTIFYIKLPNNAPNA